MAVELKVPAVGESVTEVQIGQWRREGDRVERDESVVEIESDKATVDLLAPSAGVVAKMLKKQVKRPRSARRSAISTRPVKEYPATASQSCRHDGRRGKAPRRQ